MAEKTNENVETMGLYLVACDKKFYEGRVRSIILPMADGEKGVLPHHEEMFLAVSIGEMHFQKEDGEWVDVFVSGGFAEISNNRCQVLVMTVELPEEIDYNRAMEAKERAEEELRQKRSIQEYYHSSVSLARAIERMKAAQRHMH